MSEHDHEIPNSDLDTERLSRLSGAGVPRRADSEDPDALVRAYESRYRPEEKPKRKVKPRSYSTNRITDEDKLWAAAVHSSVWLTFLMSLPTGGMSVPFVVFVPLAFYFIFRERSDFVAFHALQAFVLQLICTVGALAVFIIGGIVWLVGLVLAAMLMMLLVGFVILPIWLLVGIVASMVLGLLPLVALILSSVAAVRIYMGGDYRMPYIADWVDRQMAGGFLNA